MAREEGGKDVFEGIEDREAWLERPGQSSIGRSGWSVLAKLAEAAAGGGMPSCGGANTLTESPRLAIQGFACGCILVQSACKLSAGFICWSRLRKRTGARNAWMAERLGIGGEAKVAVASRRVRESRQRTRKLAGLGAPVGGSVHRRSFDFRDRPRGRGPRGRSRGSARWPAPGHARPYSAAAGHGAACRDH